MLNYYLISMFSSFFHIDLFVSRVHNSPSLTVLVFNYLCGAVSLRKCWFLGFQLCLWAFVELIYLFHFTVSQVGVGISEDNKQVSHFFSLSHFFKLLCLNFKLNLFFCHLEDSYECLTLFCPIKRTVSFNQQASRTKLQKFFSV